MKNITEEDGIQEEWYKEAREMTVEKLPGFIKKLTTEYSHDYGTICHAIAAASIAAAWAVEHSPEGGITGFQASAVMWEFITHWTSEYKDKPVKLVNFESMLYPQYEDKFTTISKETAFWLKLEAEKHLLSSSLHPNVKAHMEKVASGHIPFGYSIADD